MAERYLQLLFPDEYLLNGDDGEDIVASPNDGLENICYTNGTWSHPSEAQHRPTGVVRPMVREVIPFIDDSDGENFGAHDMVDGNIDIIDYLSGEVSPASELDEYIGYQSVSSPQYSSPSDDNDNESYISFDDNSEYDESHSECKLYFI